MFGTVLIVISSIIELWVCKKVFDYTSEKKYSNMRINLIMSVNYNFNVILIDPNKCTS